MKAPTPRSLIVSFFGAYGRELGGWIAVADLVDAAGPARHRRPGGALGGLPAEAARIPAGAPGRRRRGLLAVAGGRADPGRRRPPHLPAAGRAARRRLGAGGVLGARDRAAPAPPAALPAVAGSASAPRRPASGSRRRTWPRKPATRWSAWSSPSTSTSSTPTTSPTPTCATPRRGGGTSARCRPGMRSSPSSSLDQCLDAACATRQLLAPDALRPTVLRLPDGPGTTD